MSDKLKALLNDDSLYEKVSEKLNGTEIIIKDDSFGKTFIPISRLNEESEKVKTARLERSQLLEEMKEKESQIEGLQEQLTKLKESSPNTEEINNKLKNLELELDEERKGAQQKQKDFQKRSKIMTELFREKANPQYLDYLLDRVDVDWSEDGKTLVDLDKKIPELKKEFPVMFGEVGRTGIQPKPGDEPPKPDGDLYTMEELRALDQETMVDNMDKVNKSMAHWQKN